MAHVHDKATSLYTLTNKWELTEEDRRELDVTNYYLLHWSGLHLKGQLTEGVITDLANTAWPKSYAVIYRGCTPSQAFAAKQVAISFRAARLGNFALVQPIW